MNSGLFIVLGAILACMLVSQAFIAAKEAHPWRFFAGAAACSVALVGGIAWLSHWLLAWMLDTGVIWALFVIGFIFLFIWLLVGAVGALASYRP